MAKKKSIVGPSISIPQGAASKSIRRDLIVPPPSDPMAVARALVMALYMTTQGQRLCYHQGVPHIWDGTCWPEIAVRDLRRAAYHFLEAAVYIDKYGERTPWK